MQPARTVSITPTIKVGRGYPLLLMAGPCQIESLEHCLSIGQFLRDIAARYSINYVFKASYDKANRSSIEGVRGPGIERGLEILAEVKAHLNIPVVTDIHTAHQAAEAATVADVLQIPAFLCRQTDLLTAAGATGKAINVKKGQFLHPADMAHVAAKIAHTGNHHIMLCERGACFGYRDLLVDMRALCIMRETGYPVVFDATHSVQSMGGASGRSGGQREFIAPLARAAAATGIDGLFLECHEKPARAPSDADTMLPLEQVEPLLKSVCAIRQALEGGVDY